MFWAVAIVVFCVGTNPAAGSVQTVTDPDTGELVTLITVSVWHLPDPAHTDAATRADAAAVRRFVERFPEIFAERYRDRYLADPHTYGRFDWDRVQIRLRRFSGIQVEGVESDLLAIAGGVAPDILYVNFRKSDTYIQQGFLHPLDRPEDKYLTSMDREEIDFRVNERIWPVIKRPGPTGDTHVWAMPYGGALGRVLLFRRDMFDDAGLAYPDESWTWDDLIHAARVLTNPAEGRYGMGLVRARDESVHWLPFLWSAGGEVMSFDPETEEWSIDFDSRQGALALDFYTRLSTEPWTDDQGRRRYGYAFKDPGQLHLKWQRGEIAMQFAYIDEKLFATINPDLVGMVPIPRGPTGLRGAELNSRMMGLFSQIAHPAVRDAAWEFIRFYDSLEANEIKTRIMVEGGLGPFLNPSVLNRFGFGDVARLSPPGWAETFEIAINTGRPEPYGRHSNIIYMLMSVPLHTAEQMALNNQLPEDDDERLAVMLQLLQRAGDRARFEMLGELSDEQLRQRRATAFVLLAIICVVFTWVFRHIIATFTPSGVTGSAAKEGWGIRRYASAYLLLIPAVGTIFMWQYIPLLRGSIMAFQDYRLLGGSEWVWLDNFGNVLWSRDWWISIWNAIRYSLLVIGLTFLPPIVLAILLQEIPYGRIFFRTVFYLPAVITGLVVILLWKSFYDPSESGALNAVLMRIPAVAYLLIGSLLLYVAFSFYRRLWFHEHKFGAMLFLLAGVVVFYTCTRLAQPILSMSDAPVWMRLFMTLPEPYRWLQNPDTAMFACVLPLVWAGMGPNCLIYLAALKGIADDYYEAADIDGATFIDKILFIVFPILKPLIIINFVGVFISSWYGATDNILAMTGGAANTEVAGLHIFYQAFVFLQFGPATAMAWLLGLMLIGFTVYQLRILSRLEFRTTGDND